MSHLRAICPKVQAQLLEEAIKLADFYASRSNWENFQQGYEVLEGSNLISSEDKGKAARNFLDKVKEAALEEIEEAA